MSREELLLISSDPSTAETVRVVAERLGLDVKVRKSINSGIKVSNDSQIVLIDCQLSDGNSLECLQNLNALNNDMIPISIIECNNPDAGIDALKNNAVYYLLKPLNGLELGLVIQRALELKELRIKGRRTVCCTVEEFLKNKLKSHMAEIKKVGDIGLHDIVITEVERALLKLAIEETGGNQIRTSKLLGLSRNTLRNKMKKYRL